MKHIITLLFLACGFSSFSQKFNIEILSGPVYNVPTNLTLKQDGYDDYSMIADYRSEPFKLPPYYDIRLSYWFNDSSALGLKFTHHKLFLQNTNSIIEAFSISHGYNLLTATFANKIHFLKGSLFELGAGVIIGHPEGKLRGTQIDQSEGVWNLGYHLIGLVGEVALGKRIYISDFLFIPLEIRSTFGYAEVIFSEGKIIVPNLAFHFLVGIGIEIK